MIRPGFPFSTFAASLSARRGSDISNGYIYESNLRKVDVVLGLKGIYQPKFICFELILFNEVRRRCRDISGRKCSTSTSQAAEKRFQCAELSASAHLSKALCTRLKSSTRLRTVQF